jgi:hypothetical protein
MRRPETAGECDIVACHIVARRAVFRDVATEEAACHEKIA